MNPAQASSPAAAGAAFLTPTPGAASRDGGGARFDEALQSATGAAAKLHEKQQHKQLEEARQREKRDARDTRATDEAQPPVDEIGPAKGETKVAESPALQADLPGPEDPIRIWPPRKADGEGGVRSEVKPPELTVAAPPLPLTPDPRPFGPRTAEEKEAQALKLAASQSPTAPPPKDLRHLLPIDERGVRGERGELVNGTWPLAGERRAFGPPSPPRTDVDEHDPLLDPPDPGAPAVGQLPTFDAAAGTRKTREGTGGATVQPVSEGLPQMGPPPGWGGATVAGAGASAAAGAAAASGTAARAPFSSSAPLTPVTPAAELAATAQAATAAGAARTRGSATPATPGAAPVALDTGRSVGKTAGTPTEAVPADSTSAGASLALAADATAARTGASAAVRESVTSTAAAAHAAGSAAGRAAAMRDLRVGRDAEAATAPTGPAAGAERGDTAPAMVTGETFAGALLQATSGPTPQAAASALVAEARLPVPPGHAAFAASLGAQVALFVRDGVQTARLHLNPAELGPITVQIQLEGQAAQVVMAVEHAQTRTALEQALPSLAGQLREQGLTLAGGGVFEQPRDPSGQAAMQGGTSGQGGRDSAATDGAATLRAAAERVPGSRAEAGMRLGARGIVDLVA